MVILCSLLAVIFGYSTSKYFPKDVPFVSHLNLNKTIKNIISVSLYGLALIMFILEYGIATGSLVWLFTITLILSLVILALPYNTRLIFTFLSIGLIFLLIDMIGYAS